MSVLCSRILPDDHGTIKPCSSFPQLSKILSGNDKYPQFFSTLVSKICPPEVPCLAVGGFGMLPKTHEGQTSGSEEAPCFQVVLQMTGDCGNQFVAHDEKAACVVGRNTSIIQEREFLVESSAVIISVHSQRVSFAKDLDKYSVFPAHSVLKRGK